MEGRLVLKSCAVFRADGRIRGDMAVVIEGDRIARVAPDRDVPSLPGDWVVSCRGRLVAPGLVDCHAHLVGGQLLPYSGELLLRSPSERAALQHRLDLELTAAEVEVLSAFALARAARAGVTMVVEHLSCPRDVLAALGAQARCAERIGMRLCNSHASSSIDGAGAGLAQADQNAQYLERPPSALVRPALGFHASFSSDGALLDRLAECRRRTQAAVHFHLAESEEDLRVTDERDHKRITARLADYGLLGAGCVAAYARAVGHGESEQLATTRTLVALSPRLALATEPGDGGLEALLAHPTLLGLGSSGLSLLWDELVSAFASAVQLARHARLLDPDDLMSRLLIAGPGELCSMLYGAPSGTVEEGSLADLVLYDLVPAQEAPGGLAPHLLLQLGQVQVAWTIVGGRVVVREGELLGNDYVDLAQEAAKVLEHVWSSVPA